MMNSDDDDLQMSTGTYLKVFPLNLEGPDIYKSSYDNNNKYKNLFSFLFYFFFLSLVRHSHKNHMSCITQDVASRFFISLKTGTISEST